MRRLLLIITGILFIAMLAGCAANEEAGEMSLFSKKMIVGTDIAFEDITDFYYTEENINYDADYQRYRFYAEDGKHFFFHETRERKNDYGPCTEEDTVQTGTIELSDDQWSEFTALVKGGIVTVRKDTADSGGSGPWLYLYWTNDKSKYQQFSFESYETEAKFEEFCLILAPKDDTVKYKLKFSDSIFESERTMYAPGEEVIVRYDIIATDTDYRFYSDDVDFEETYDGGYVFTFVMPEHDVTLKVESRNSMEYDPNQSVADMNEVSEDMRLLIDGKEVPVTWKDNESVDELKDKCPLTIQMSMYGGFEQVGSLGSSITRDDEQITTDFGDIVLYSGDQIVIFYGSNSWAYTRLGHVDMTKEELTELLGNGDVEIVIE